MTVALTLSKEFLAQALVAKKTLLYAGEEKYKGISYGEQIYPQARMQFKEYDKLYPTNEQFTEYFVRDFNRKDAKLLNAIRPGATAEQILSEQPIEAEVQETTEVAGEEVIPPKEAVAGAGTPSTMIGGIPSIPKVFTPLEGAGKTLASEGRIGVKKGLTGVGRGFSGMLGGVGRGLGGILSGVGSGGVRFLGGAGSALSNMGTQMTRGRGLVISGKFWLIFLGGFLLVGGLAAFAPAPAPGQPGPSPSPGPVTSPSPQPSLPPTGVVASCPVPNGRITTHSYEYASTHPGTHGHCDASYPRPCKCGTNGRRAKAIDVPNGGQDVILPTIDGRPVNWKFKFAYLIDAADGGGNGFVFEASTATDGTPLTAIWTLDMLHMASTGLNTNLSYPSNTAAGKTSGGHVHFTLGKNITNNTSPGLETAEADCHPGWIPSDFMCR